MKLDRATVDLIKQAIRDGDVFSDSAAEAENGPAGTEGRIGNGHELATAKKRAGIVLGLDIAIADRDMLATDEMKSIVIAIDAIVDVEGVHVNASRLDDTHAMVGAAEQIDIANREALTTVEQESVGTAVAAKSAGRRDAARGRMKLRALAIDRAGTFHGDVDRIHSENEGPVSVFQSGIAVKRDGVDGVILLAVGAAQQFSASCYTQSDIASEFERADEECARRNQDNAAALAMAFIDGGLHRRRVQRNAIAFRAVIADVIDPRAEIVLRRRGLRSIERCGKRRGESRYRQVLQPLTAILHERKSNNRN